MWVINPVAIARERGRGEPHDVEVAQTDVFIDPFLGSGSTLIAAETTGRVCRGVELDPLYVDVIIRRYEAASGETATLVETGETFADLAERRAPVQLFTAAALADLRNPASSARRALPCASFDPSGRQKSA